MVLCGNDNCDYISDGDCAAYVQNYTGMVLEGYPLFVVLDVYGNYYFAPSFSDYDNYLERYPRFEEYDTEIPVIDPFYWPADTGSAENIRFIGALTDPEITHIFGTMDTWTFGWSD